MINNIHPRQTQFNTTSYTVRLLVTVLGTCAVYVLFVVLCPPNLKFHEKVYLDYINSRKCVNNGDNRLTVPSGYGYKQRNLAGRIFCNP